MTPSEFKQARHTLGFSQSELAKKWSMGVNGARTIRRWEEGERPLNPIAAYCIELMVEVDT
jgi:DNA-binding transcriptional regulator YiaG